MYKYLLAVLGPYAKYEVIAPFYYADILFQPSFAKRLPRYLNGELWIDLHKAPSLKIWFRGQPNSALRPLNWAAFLLCRYDPYYKPPYNTLLRVGGQLDWSDLEGSISKRLYTHTNWDV